MKKDRLMPIFLFSLALFLVSFIFGYQFMARKLKSNDNISSIDREYKDEEFSDLQIIGEENIITPNTFLEERISYTACGHVLTKIQLVDDQFINMTKKEFTNYLDEYYPNKKLIAFSTRNIVIGITKNHLCENHFIVGEEEGNIAIFKINENGERILDKAFSDYPISLLMEIDQEKIIEGIIVDSEEELSDILENFIS